MRREFGNVTHVKELTREERDGARLRVVVFAAAFQLARRAVAVDPARTVRTD